MRANAARCTIPSSLKSLARNIFQTIPVLVALLVTAFVTLYPQLDATGYCSGAECAETSAYAHGFGGGLAGSCLLAAALVSGSALAAASTARLARSQLSGVTPRSLCLSPEPPPPKPCP